MVNIERFIKGKMSLSSMTQLKDVRSLDALLVLGGEGSDHSRSDHTNSLYKSRAVPIEIVLSGNSSGLKNLVPVKPEADVMRDYLIEKGIPNEFLHTETKSLDTLGNIVFSWPILDDILSGFQTKRLGLVTDNFHMMRALWTAKRVLPDSYAITPLPSEKNADVKASLMERAVKYAIAYDLAVLGVEKGDKFAFENYLKSNHPMHVKNAPIGAYKSGISFFKLLELRK